MLYHPKTADVCSADAEGTDVESSLGNSGNVICSCMRSAKMLHAVSHQIERKEDQTVDQANNCTDFIKLVARVPQY